MELSSMKPALIASLLASFLAAALGQAQSGSEPLIKQTFKDDAAGWSGVGNWAKVTVTHQGPIAPVGLGALEFDYKVQKGTPDALILPIEVGKLAKAKSIKFKMMADTDGPFVVMLQEKDGGHYVAMCAAKKNAWQTCELSPDDFSLTQEGNDPKDPDGKLDMDQVQMIAIVDMEEMLVNGGNPDIERLLHVQPGSHTLFIESFSVGTDPVPSDITKADGIVSLDRFVHPQLSWFGVGEVKLEVADKSPLTARSLKLTYRQQPNQFVGATMSFNPGTLTGCKNLSFDISSISGGTLRVQVEEVGGIKFSTSIDLPTAGKVKHVSLDFADFRSTDDTSDPKAKLDPSKIKTLLLFDPSGVMAQFDQEHPDNVMFVGNLESK